MCFEWARLYGQFSVICDLFRFTLYLEDHLVLFSTAVRGRRQLVTLRHTLLHLYVLPRSLIDDRLKQLGRISLGNICELAVLLVSSPTVIDN